MVYDPGPKKRKTPAVCLREGVSKTNQMGKDFATGNKSPKTASGVARHLNSIPHDTFVDVMHGQGNVYRKTKPVEKEILNDISPQRISCSKALSCATQDKKNCERFNKAKKSTQDYRPVVRRNDKKGALIYMDPPYSKTKYTGYKQKGITPEQLHDISKKVKHASVAVSYSENPDFKRLFCGTGGFTCHKIQNNIFSVKYHELLAVKKR